MPAAAPRTPPATTPFEVAGRRYQPPPHPVVVLCIDGCSDGYLDEAFAHGRAPHLARLATQGYRGSARGALPSFTNVNNASIVTGASPAVHGIAGNFFLDPESGEAVMMNDARFLREDTILRAAARAGRRVAVVTAKDKLRTLLDLGKEGGIQFSTEKASQADLERFGIEDLERAVGRNAPEIYSGDASVWACEAGAMLLERDLADFVYVTLSDYVQHKSAPDTEEALQLYEGIDRAVGRWIARGAIVGVTADHGMSGKAGPDGEPKVVWVESLLRSEFSEGLQVVCTITDPYVVHHGALGGCVQVHADPSVDLGAVERFLMEQEGITEVHPRERAAQKLELPADRIGDLVVLGGRDWVLGRTPEDHDLSKLGGIPLRSHGGRYEEMVPLLSSVPLPDAMKRRATCDLRSFDLFACLCPAEVSA